jgi:hypothetical protein
VKRARHQHKVDRFEDLVYKNGLVACPQCVSMNRNARFFGLEAGDSWTCMLCDSIVMPSVRRHHPVGLTLLHGKHNFFGVHPDVASALRLGGLDAALAIMEVRHG